MSFPVTPFPDQTPVPRVEVVKAVERLIVELGRHKGLRGPVIVDGTNCSIDIRVFCEAEQVAEPTV